MTTRCPSHQEFAWRNLAAVVTLLGVAAMPLSAREAAAANPFQPDHPYVYRTDASDECEYEYYEEYCEGESLSEPPYDDFIQILPVEGTGTLRLFITADASGDAPNPGSGTGTPCVVGSGGLDSDHVCAFNVNFEIGDSGLGQFVSFTPNSALAAAGMLSVPAAGTFPPNQTTFSINFVNSDNPLAPGVFPGGGVHELGFLQVEALGAGMAVYVRAGDSVRSETLAAIDMTDPSVSLSNLTGDTMQPHAIAVPEPGTTLSLVSALAGLGGLYRLRRRGA